MENSDDHDASILDPMPDEPDTRPDSPRSKSSVETFSLDALLVRIDHEARLARQRADEVTASLLEGLGRVVELQINGRNELIHDLLLLVTPCGKCAGPATRRLVAGYWCDACAPNDASDIPKAASVRRAMKL
jgi:hypothetical protein